MVARLQHEGALRTPRIAAAFRAVSRAAYIDDADADRDGRSCADMPLKIGAVHLSAPSIYAFAAEMLAVRPGDSFLNVGSGTGYFTSIVALLAGADAVNHGVEQSSELVERARAMAAANGLPHLEFFHANALQLRIAPAHGEAGCMTYDRIYVAAAIAPPERNVFLPLLSEGGVLVGPFEEEGLSHQFLCKVVRTSADSFVMTRFQPVQFAPLLRPAAAAQLAPLVLAPLVWSPEEHSRFPARFQAAVRTLLCCATQPECPLALLPRELLFRIVGCLHFCAFAGPSRALAFAPSPAESQDADESPSSSSKLTPRSPSGTQAHSFMETGSESDSEDDSHLS